MISARSKGSRRAIALVAALAGALQLLWAAPPDYAAERTAMVNRLREREIRNKGVLAAMGEVPRHLFVGEAHRARAYDSADIPLGAGHVMCSPYITALMAQAVDARPGAKVLEVGTGSGYLSAVLAEITPQVYTIDAHPELAALARQRLQSLGYSSVRLRTGRACEGWAEEGPFEGIVVTCAANGVPEALIQQLREGGRLVIPIGHGPEQTLTCVRKSGGRLRSETMAAIRVSPMECQSAR